MPKVEASLSLDNQDNFNAFRYPPGDKDLKINFENIKNPDNFWFAINFVSKISTVCLVERYRY